MRKTIPIILAATSLFSGIHAQEQRGVVFVDALKMRPEPSLEGKPVTVLTKGTIVKILAESPHKTTVDAIEAPWLQVEASTFKGWVFGGYVTTEFKQANGRDDALVWTYEKPANNQRTITLYLIKQKKEFKIVSSMETAEYQFSEDLKYLATDEGTDVIGTITIYDLKSGRKIEQSGHSPRNIRWQGNKIHYESVLCTDDGFLITETMAFEGGKIRKTGAYSRGGYHAGMEPGGCKKYLRLLKK